jgi:hypothetical protein
LRLADIRLREDAEIRSLLTPLSPNGMTSAALLHGEDLPPFLEIPREKVLLFLFGSHGLIKKNHIPNKKEENDR